MHLKNKKSRRRKPRLRHWIYRLIWRVESWADTQLIPLQCELISFQELAYSYEIKLTWTKLYIPHWSVCVHVCVSLTGVYMYVCMCVIKYGCLCLYVCLYLCVCVCTFVCVHTGVSVSHSLPLSPCVYVSVCVCVMCVCVCVCVCVYTRPGNGVIVTVNRL